MERIVILSYDGIKSKYCGIGSITETFIKSLNTSYYSNKFSLDVIYVNINKHFFGYNEFQFNTIKYLVKNLGGNLYGINNRSFSPFGEYKNWDYASKNASKKIVKLLNNYEPDDKIHIICIDLPFISVPYHLNKILGVKYERLNLYTKLHSTGVIHFGKSIDKDRLKYEKLHLMINNNKDNVKFVSTSEYLKTNLIKHYNINRKKFINLQSGINIIDSNDDFDTKNYLTSKGISLTKPIIFMYGRSEYYKGFHLLIKACKNIYPDIDFQLVILCPPYSNKDNYNLYIRKLLGYSDLDYIFINKVDFDLPKVLTSYENTRIVCCLSYKEPFGLIPSYTRLRAKQNGGIILCSNKDGFKEQIINNVDGFKVSLNINDISNLIKYIFKLDNNTLDIIRKNGYKRLVTDYDYDKNVNDFLKCIIKG